MPLPRNALLPSEAFAEQMREARLERRWSLADMAERLEERLGVSMHRSTVDKLERGRKARSVSLDDALVIAAALDVAPIHLIVRRDKGKMRLHAAGRRQTFAASEIRHWIKGEVPLLGTSREVADLRFFDEYRPEEEIERKQTPGLAEIVKLANDIIEAHQSRDGEALENAVAELEEQIAHQRVHAKRFKRLEGRK
jgi:transcriptional regulator with XRE-family HTH domain